MSDRQNPFTSIVPYLVCERGVLLLNAKGVGNTFTCWVCALEGIGHQGVYTVQGVCVPGKLLHCERRSSVVFSVQKGLHIVLLEYGLGEQIPIMLRLRTVDLAEAV